MNTYETDAVKDTENLALKLLEDIGIACSASNTSVKTDVDITTDTNKKIDVQYSNNFAKYGDFRVDIVSAFVSRRTTGRQTNHNNEILNKFEEENHCIVEKEGKIFQPNYVDFLIVFFYDNMYQKNTTENILIIKVSELHNYINQNAEDLFGRIKINDKRRYNLPDRHGSAFLPVNVEDLQNNCTCFFGTWKELVNQKDNIIRYIN